MGLIYYENNVTQILDDVRQWYSSREFTESYLVSNDNEAIYWKTSECTVHSEKEDAHSI